MMPRLRIGSGTLHCPTPSRIAQPPFVFSVTALLVLGLCLCDRVVSLWNSGGGLCRVEGRVVPAVYCQLFMCCVVLWNGGEV